MTTTAYEDVLGQMATIEAAIAGVGVAYERAPEGLTVLPAFVNYPLRGESEYSAGEGVKDIRTLLTVCYVARGDSQTGEDKARPFIDLFEDAVYADPTLGGTVDTVITIRHSYGKVLWGLSEWFIGIRFEVDFKMRRIIP